MNTQFNPVSGSVFSGRNETSALEAKAEHSYKSDKWITYFQAKELDILDGCTLKGKAVGMVRFTKTNGKSNQVWYNVFNLDLFTGVPKKVANCKTPVAKATPKKAAKAAPKKASATKVAPKKAALNEVTAPVATPVQGMPGTFLMPQANGTYLQITI